VVLYEKFNSEKSMARSSNVKQSDGKNCLNVCHTNGEMDMLTRTISPAGSTAVIWYTIRERLVFETVALRAGAPCREGPGAWIKADAARFFSYKFANSPDRA